MNAKRKDARIHCNQCGRETKHEVVAERSLEESIVPDPSYPVTVDFVSTWRMLECRGCEAITLRQTEWCSEDDPTTIRPSTFYPPRLSRRKPSWMERAGLPIEYSCLLDEVYVALHADSRRLAAMGARALIDEVIRRQVGDQGDFKNGLDELVKKGFLSTHNRELINAAVDAGHASAHRSFQPSTTDINTVIDIVENLIQNELLATSASALKAATPPRLSRGKSKTENRQ